MIFGPHLQTPRVLLFLLFISTLFRALGASVNVTVDDQNGDSSTGAKPTYAPSGVWNLGPQCTGCLVQPDPSLAFDNTWHDATDAPNDTPYTITYTFQGTAVYAFFILANQVQFATTFSNWSFTLDGALAGEFVHNPDSTTNFEYNVNAFSRSGLSNSQHTIVISDNVGTNDSLILFDYLIYTTEDIVTTTTSSSTSSTITSSTSRSSRSSSSGSSTSSSSPSQSQLSSLTSETVSTHTAGASPTGSAFATSQTQGYSSPSTAGSASQSTSSAEPTSADNSTSSTNSKTLGVIIGSTVAGSAVLLLAGLLLLWRCRARRRERRSRDSFGNLQPYANIAPSSSTFVPTEAQWRMSQNAGPAQLSSVPAGAQSRMSQDFLILTPSSHTATEGALSHDLMQDPFVAGRIAELGHDRLSEQPSIRRGPPTRPPTYIPARQPIMQTNLDSKWSEESPQLASTTPLSQGRNTTEPSSALPGSQEMDSSSQADDHWVPSAPSEYSEEAPPRYLHVF